MNITQPHESRKNILWNKVFFFFDEVFHKMKLNNSNDMHGSYTYAATTVFLAKSKQILLKMFYNKPQKPIQKLFFEVRTVSNHTMYIPLCGFNILNCFFREKDYRHTAQRDVDNNNITIFISVSFPSQFRWIRWENIDPNNTLTDVGGKYLPISFDAHFACPPEWSGWAGRAAII